MATVTTAMSVETAPNRLYFGDCLDVMREDIADESVDLIYLDPPFNSKRIYNASMGGAQWVAFNDTWQWFEAVEDFHAVAGDVVLAPTMEGLRRILGEGPNLAYLSYMANRLRECRRVLKPTGSIYLHCDPTMNYLLRVVMDAIFGADNFRNELVWNRSKNPKGSQHGMRRYSPFTDTILYYARAAASLDLDAIRVPLSPEEYRRKYPRKDSRGRYADGPILRSDSMGPRPNLVYEYKGFTPGPAGWRVKRSRLEEIDDKGDLAWTGTGVRRKLRPAAMEKGKPVGSLWNDIAPLNSQAKERLGYPTQKPLVLLERIIRASSSPGDLVLDPFCGCGTTLHAAQEFGRRWIGIDVCVKACQVIEERLRGHFDSLWTDVEYIGMPKTPDHARKLASMDAFRFERWAASLAPGMEANKRQRADGGIDGWGRIALRKGRFADVVSQVKGGSTNPGHVQAFNGARQQAGADMGIFTCFEDRVTDGMRNAAASAGRFLDAPALQIYTVEDFFEGRQPQLPRVA